MNFPSQQKIREDFLDFFKKKSHSFVASSSLVPKGDKTILFSNSGMNQFKDIFLELKKPDHLRVCNYQKCIRLSGKHNDLEEVGLDSYHHTFFEMLGNWSFGDYYKKEAIAWAWELLTEVWKLPKEKLFATVYHQDDESVKLWQEMSDIKHENILKFGEKDNFWEMADVGPCGPCSEVHIDLGIENCTCEGEERKKKCRTHGGGVNQDCARYIEIWNLVFIQFNRNKEKQLTPLKKVHVDTGMGFERICRVLQNKASNYDTDVFAPLIKEIEKITALSYNSPHEKNNIAFRVIADHIRTIVFSIADGVIPSNEGRGYVIRRVLRRAFRYGKTLGLEKPFLNELATAVSTIMAPNYPALKSKLAFIKKMILNEEELFLTTLNKGLALFEKLVEETKKNQMPKIDGEKAFELYDTYGFPWDLIKLLAKENDLEVVEEEFNLALEKQKSLASNVKKEEIDPSLVADLPPTIYVGEKKTKSLGKLMKIIQGANSIRVLESLEDSDRSKGDVFLVFAETCFYGESGGQIGDRGEIYNEDKSDFFQVTNAIKIEDRYLLQGKLKKGKLATGEHYYNEINSEARNEIRKNHSATHLLQQALINHLGEHVKQAGSLITSEKLRFDFNHYQRLNESEIEKIEREVNEEIIKKTLIETEIVDYEEAIEEGIRAFFEEKYQDKVRVVKMGDYSKELCGGSHVANTSEIGNFKIISENGVASGIRRIEAITGRQANLDYLRTSKTLKSLQQIFNAQGDDDLKDKIIALKKSILETKSEQTSMKKRDYLNKIEQEKLLLVQLILYFFVFKNEDDDLLKNIIDKIKAQEAKSIVFFVNQKKNKSTYFIALGEEAGRIHRAGDLIVKVNEFAKGNGGGKKTFAQGGGDFISDPLLLRDKFKTLLHHE